MSEERKALIARERRKEIRLVTDEAEDKGGIFRRSRDSE